MGLACAGCLQSQQLLEECLGAQLCQGIGQEGQGHLCILPPILQGDVCTLREAHLSPACQAASHACRSCRAGFS